ncbi:MAG: DUF4157 domain-containing protein [Ignavibacteriales bacterium]|nr:DUF4157 domain-containing protein [Ignavibacteriales bacterium]
MLNKHITLLNIQNHDTNIEDAILPLKETVGISLTNIIDSERSLGKQLDAGILDKMENSFHQSLKHVRLHVDEKADRILRELKTIAFASANDIFIQRAIYSQDLNNQFCVLTHEITHVIEHHGENMISFWSSQYHTSLTREGTRRVGITDNNFIARLERESTYTDYQGRLFHIPGWPFPIGLPSAQTSLYLTGIRRGEGPDHGEGANYTTTVEHARRLNKQKQDEYLGNAIQNYSNGNFNQAIIFLGRALHVAQDRGAHGEGAIGRGHDDPYLLDPDSRAFRTPDGRIREHYGWEDARQNTYEVLYYWKMYKDQIDNRRGHPLSLPPSWSEYISHEVQ